MDANPYKILKRTFVTLVAVGALAAAALNCSSSAGNDANGSDDALSAATVKALCDDFNGARCDEYMTFAPEGFATEYFSKADCIQDRTATCVAKYTSKSINATAKDLKTCFDAYGKLAKPDFKRFNNDPNPPMPAACAPLWHGKVADGKGCAFDSECAGGHCVKDGSCGTCETKKPAGTACASDAQCEPGLGCKSDGKCGARADLGGACGQPGDCMPGQFCDSGKCAAPLADGVACSMASGYVDCDWTNGRVCDTASHTCQVEAIHQYGEECAWEPTASGDYFFRGQCGPGFRCARNAVRAYCVKRVHAGDGCFVSDGPDGAQCDHQSDCIDGTCVARSAAACSTWTTPAPPAGANPGNLPIMNDYGGPTLHNVEIITVTFPGYKYTSDVRGLDEHLATSGYVATVGSEYGLKSAHHLTSVEVDEPLTGTITNEAIQDFLVKKIAAGILPKPPAAFSPDHAYYYSVYIPSDLIVSGPPYGETCKGVGAYHDIVTYPYTFAYGLIANCTMPPGYVLSDLQWLEATAAHELIEGMTDPALNESTAWYTPNGSIWDATGGEVVDYCDYNYFTEAGFTIARSWSNKNAAAGKDPCLPLEAGNPPYYNLKGDTAVTAAAGTTATFKLTGWAEAARAPWDVDTKSLRDGISLPAGAITVDKAKVGVGDTATVSIAIPATAKSGQTASFSIQSRDKSSTALTVHRWVVQVTVK